MAAIDRLKGAVFLPVGLGLMVAGIYAYRSTRDFMARSLVAPGLVIAESHGPHHVQIRFRTGEGRVVTYGQNGMVTLYTGEHVRVRYDPRDPDDDPCVDQWLALWEGAIFMGLMGGVFALIGAGLLLGKLADPEPERDAAA